jgi:hypothetical protein
MPIEMLETARGMLDGKEVRFEAGKTYSKAEGTINDRLAESFVRDGLARKIEKPEPESKKRAAQSKAEYK